MAFTDPQSLTINAVPFSMPRISDETSKSVYANSDGTCKMTISHQSSGQGTSARFRDMVRVDRRVMDPDPLTTVGSYQDLGIYLVIDRPFHGYSPTDIDYVVQALKTWLATASVLKVVGLEH